MKEIGIEELEEVIVLGWMRQVMGVIERWDCEYGVVLSLGEAGGVLLKVARWN